MQPKAKIRLGDLLVQNNIITEPQLMQALSAQRESGRKLGAVLVEQGFVSEHDLLTFLSQHLQVPLINIPEYRVQPEHVKLLPEVQARRYRAIVLDDKGDKLLVGMSDPADINAVDALSGLLPKPLTLAVVAEAQLFEAYDSFYRRT